MIPAAITLIPAFLLLRDLKLLDSYHAIWWPAAASVTGIFLLRQHFYSIPSELEDAARVDGAGRFRIFWQVCLPLVTNSLAALAIFTFLGLWNDLFWPLIVLSKQIVLTLPSAWWCCSREATSSAGWPSPERLSRQCPS